MNRVTANPDAERMHRAAERMDRQAERADRDGERVDRAAERVDRDGRRVDRAAERVDRDGRRVDGVAEHMDRALRLAAQGRGRTSPNPMVGAVIVAPSGEVVGEGFHERAGGDHAEIRALAQAGPRARGATLYCTLEPCCHEGRTGPCAPRVAEAGIARVVVAMVDPNPRVRGGGLAHLRARGVAVDVGTRGAEAERLNEAFVTRVKRGRPFVTMKVAVSLDGRIAARPGARTALTGVEAQRAVHEERAVVDAVGVGSTTLLVDDPRLTARGPARHLPLARVVFDRRLRTPPTARVLGTPGDGPVLILAGARAVTEHPEARLRLEAAGAEVVPLDGDGIEEALRRLGARGVTTLVLEGGTVLHRAAWEAGVVDRVRVFIAPVVLGPGGVDWLDWRTSVLARLGGPRVRPLGSDVEVAGDVHGNR